MSLNVGELAFYLTLDDSAYLRGMKKAGTLAQGLQKSMKAAGNVVATALTASTGAAAGLTAGLVKAGGQYNSLQQNSRAALTTLLGSQKAVNEQMSKLNELAARSPFSKSIFIQGQQQLLAFGMQAEKVIPALDAIQNAVAATGGSSQQLSDITFVLAQIQAAGKITGQDLMQLGQRGIDAASLIGNTLGKTGAQIRQDITSGSLSAQDAIDALTQGMAAKFGGATDKIKQQWTGATDRISAAWRDTGARIAKPFIDPNGGGQAVVWANRVADIMRQVQKHVDSAMTTIEHRAGPVFASVTRHLEKTAATVARFNMHGLIRQIDKLTSYAPLVAGVSGALLTMGTANLPVIGRLAAGLNPLIVGLGALAATSPQLRTVGGAFIDALAPAAPFIYDTVRALADLTMQLIHTLQPALIQVAHGTGNFLSSLAPLAPAFVQLLHASLPVVNAVGNLAAAVANLPTPLLASVAALVAFHGPLSKTRGLIMTATDAISGVISSLVNFWKTSKTVASEAGGGISAMMVATRAATTGLSGALRALLTPTNLVGLGLTALTAIVTAFAAKKAEAQKNAQDFASTLDQETGAITENTRAWVAHKLEEENALAALEQLGISTNSAVDALINQGQAYETLTGKVSQARQSLADYTDGMGGLTLEGIELEHAIQTLEDVFPRLSDTVTTGAEAQRRVSDAMANTSEQAQQQTQALNALTQAQNQQAAANGDLIAAQYATLDATEALNTAINESMGIHRDEAGNIDLATNANRDFVEKAREKITAINREIQALIKTGATQDEVNARQETLTSGLYQQLQALGIVGEEAEEFARKLGLIPHHVATTIDMSANTKEAATRINQFVAEMKNKSGTVTIYANDTPATQTLAASLGLVKVSEGVYTINANSNPAHVELLASLGKVNTSAGVITIDGNSQKAIAAAEKARKNINNSPGEIQINGRDHATETARQAQRNINTMEAAIKVWFQPQNNVRVSYADGLHKENGGVVSYYAHGGIKENHVAQIAPAGSWRVWAEPETGGEAYIPLSAAKRQRSQKIMAEVARRFGDFYMPAQGYANHPATGGGSTPASTTTVNFGTVTIDASSLEAIATVSDLVHRLGYSQLMNDIN